MKVVLRYQQIASKMYKTHVLSKNELVLPYIPDTRWYNRIDLKEMLREYSTVFIKPDKGGGAGGLIRLEVIDDLVECTSPYGRKKLIPSSQLSEWVQDQLKKDKRYILQQGISLAKMNGRPFDLRVHMQKPDDTWLVSGTCAKIAAPGQVVTNYCKGGTPSKVAEVILSITSKSKIQAQAILLELYHLSKQIAKTLNSQFKGLKELGIDIGVDENLQLWIFEVNTRPCTDMFRKLGDGETYHKIKKIQQQFI